MSDGGLGLIPGILEKLTAAGVYVAPWNGVGTLPMTTVGTVYFAYIVGDGVNPPTALTIALNNGGWVNQESGIPMPSEGGPPVYFQQILNALNAGGWPTIAYVGPDDDGVYGNTMVGQVPYIDYDPLVDGYAQDYFTISVVEGWPT